MNLIKALQENEKSFGLMSEEMQAKLREVYTPLNLDIYLADGWVICGSSDFLCEKTYRLRLGYEAPEEKPEIVECKVRTDMEDEMLCYNKPQGQSNPLSCAFDDPDFIGFKYEGQYITPSPRLYLHKSGQAHDRVSSGYMAEYKVLAPIHVLFRKGE
jgi:hypothetical protein